MKYFCLGQDTRMPNGVLLTNVNAINGYYEYKKGNVSLLDDSFVSMVHSSPVNFYPDILDRQIFMVKGAVKEVLDMFTPDMQYKHCCLLDEPNQKYEQYFIPLFDTVDAHTGAEMGLYIFRNKNENNIEVLASLEFVEVLLRRKPTGVRVKKSHV
jgi:hypothetical protein